MLDSISLPNSMRPCSPPEMTLTGFFPVAGEQQAAQRATDQGFRSPPSGDGGAGVAGDPFGQADASPANSALVLRVVAGRPFPPT